MARNELLALEEDDPDALMSILDHVPAASEAPSFDTSSLDVLMQQATTPGALAKQDAPAFDTSALDSLVGQAGQAVNDALDAHAGAPSAGYKPAGELSGMDSDLLSLAEPSGGAQTPTQQMAGAQPKEAAGQVIGESGNAFGVDDPREDLLKARDRARELYQQQPTQDLSGPGQEEPLFASQNERPSENDMRRAWVLNSLATMFGADDDLALRVHDMMTRKARDYDQGLTAARAADRAARPRRADLATAELAALSGLSPEAAASLTENSPSINLLKAGGINIGKGLRGQDTGVLRENIGQTGDTYRQAVTEEGDRRAQELAAQTALQTAQIRKRTEPGGGGGGGQDSGLVPFLVRNQGIPQDVAEAAANGRLDESKLTPEMALKVKTAVAGWKSLPRKKRDEITTAYLKESSEAGQGKTAYLASLRDRDKRMKYRNDFTASRKQALAAIGGLKMLQANPAALKAYLSIAKGAGGDPNRFSALLQKATFGKNDRIAVGAIQSLVNDLMAKRSGASVSNQEMDRLMTEVGLPSGVDLFNDPGALQAWLNRLMDKINSEASEYNRAYGADNNGQDRLEWAK